jgi:antitoxin (DNA-binding transcriptional repressor) of toxin-antitoxin stability system
MRRIGVREFKMQATSLLSSGETIIVEKHGKPIGYYVPIKPVDRKAARAAAARLDKTIKGILERTGMTEDEFVDEIMREPWPRQPRS